MIKRTRIFHFTNIKNLPGIIGAERLLCNNQVAEAGTRYTDVASREIQLRRARTEVTCGPGGVLPNYVPFFFAARSPMLFRIYKDVDIYPEGQEPLVYLVSNIETARDERLPFVFTDGHPIMRYTRFYDRLEDLDKLDWEVMSGRMWNDDDDHPDRQRKREAEFLVHRSLPWELVAGIAVINEEMLERVEQALEPADYKPQVRVVRDWYYS